MRNLLIFSTKSENREIPYRIQKLITEQEIRNEQLIGLVQLALALLILGLFLFSKRPTDADLTGHEPVPIVLSAYIIFTLIRLLMSYRGYLPHWSLITSIFIDMSLLIGLIWIFHIQYNQPIGFSLKAPTFIYIFLLIGLRVLRFDHRYVLLTGLFAAFGWVFLVLLVIYESEPNQITHNFVTYQTSSKILIGAEFEKIVTILLITFVLTLAVWRTRKIFIKAMQSNLAVEDISRFVSNPVANVITNAENKLSAGQAVERYAAVIMLDIRGFTAFSQTVPPAKIVETLTSLHKLLVPIIEKHNGIVDKFIGDGIMATFGAVSVSENAAADALQALHDIVEIVNQWEKDLPIHGVTATLKVNGAATFGRLVFATLGSSERLEYTVIGKPANLAAKLEKHNKAEDTCFLLPLDMLEQAKKQGFIIHHKYIEHQNCAVEGIKEPIDLVAIC